MHGEFCPLGYELDSVSFGGGVQSTAMAVLAAEGLLGKPVFIFANTGADSEDPRTLEYVAQHSRPYIERHGFEFVEVAAEGETLYQATTNMETARGALIPMRGENGAPFSRQCTQSWKIVPIHREIKRRMDMQGLRVREGSRKRIVRPWRQGIGFSLDEAHRMKVGRVVAFFEDYYPLIDLRLTRADCLAIIRRAGLPEPPQSACWFCPWKTRAKWVLLRKERPDLFAKAVELEATVQEKLQQRGLRSAWMSDHGAQHRMSLDEVIGDQAAMFDDEDFACSGNHCMV